VLFATDRSGTTRDDRREFLGLDKQPVGRFGGIQPYKSGTGRCAASRNRDGAGAVVASPTTSATASASATAATTASAFLIADDRK